MLIQGITCLNQENTLDIAVCFYYKDYYLVNVQCMLKFQQR